LRLGLVCDMLAFPDVKSITKMKDCRKPKHRLKSPKFVARRSISAQWMLQ
jgi:hypothetical protein